MKNHRSDNHPNTTPENHTLAAGTVTTELGHPVWIIAEGAAVEARTLTTHRVDNDRWMTTNVEAVDLNGERTLGIAGDRWFDTLAEATAEAEMNTRIAAEMREREAARWASMTNAEQCASMSSRYSD